VRARGHGHVMLRVHGARRFHVRAGGRHGGWGWREWLRGGPGVHGLRELLGCVRREGWWVGVRGSHCCCGLLARVLDLGLKYTVKVMRGKVGHDVSSGCKSN